MLRIPSPSNRPARPMFLAKSKLFLRGCFPLKP